jgi:hypothetical protein
MPKYSSENPAFREVQDAIVMGMYMGHGHADDTDEDKMHLAAAKFLTEYKKQYRLLRKQDVDWTAQRLDEHSAALALHNLPLAKSKTRKITWDEESLIRGAIGTMMPLDDAAPSGPMLISNGEGDVTGPTQPQVVRVANGYREYHTFTAVPVDLGATTDYAPTRLLVNKRKTTEPAEPDAEPDSATNLKRPKYTGEEEPTSEERSQEEPTSQEPEGSEDESSQPMSEEPERSQPMSEELIVVSNLKDEHGNTLSDKEEARHNGRRERTRLEEIGLHESIVIDDDEEPDYGPEPVSYVKDQDVFVKAECLRYLQWDSLAPFDICGFRAKVIAENDASEVAIRFLVVPGTTQNALYSELQRDGDIEHTAVLPLSLIAPCR